MTQLSPQPQHAQLPSRSAFRKAALSPQPRRRRYLLRLGLVLLVGAIGGGLVLAVAMRAFTSALWFRPAYWLHDHVFLPLKGQVWTAIFPYALLWLVPLGAIMLIAMAEFLLPVSPTARLHRFILRRLAGFATGRQLMALWPRRYGFLVAEELCSESWAACTLHKDIGSFDNQRAAMQLAQRAALRWQLGQKAPGDQLAIFETAALLMLIKHGRPAYDLHLQPIIAKLPPKSPLARQFAWLLAPNALEMTEGEALDITLWLANGGADDTGPAPTDIQLAALVIRLGQLGLSQPLHSAGAFFGAWARALTGGHSEPMTGVLNAVQGMVQFEFWSCAADNPGTAQPDLLARQLGNPPTLPDRGDGFAWGGPG